MNSNQVVKKRKLGRASRRREAKSRQIQKAVYDILHPSSSLSSSSLSLPHTSSTNDGNHKSTQEQEQNNIQNCDKFNQDDTNKSTNLIHDNHSSSNTTQSNNDRNLSLPGVLELRKIHNNNDWNHIENEDNINIIIKDSTISKMKILQQDGQILTSQLGFIPGNAISISSRVCDLDEEKYPHLHKLLIGKQHCDEQHCDDDDSNSSKQKKTINEKEILDSKLHPTVLKLYPLVIRNVCNKKTFSSRKRTRVDMNDIHIHSNTLETEKVNNDDTRLKHDDSNVMNKENLLETKKISSSSSSSSQPIDSSSITIEPFPTIYWLTHPHLRMLISQIELNPATNVRSLEQRLKTTSSSSSHNHHQKQPIEAMKQSHKSYAQDRWNLLTKHDQLDMKKRKWDQSAFGLERGVAGIRNVWSIKCLHTHAAHYLAKGDNIVGEWVMEYVEELVKRERERGV